MISLKTFSAGLAVAALGTSLVAATPAAADPGAVIAGVIGGAALGAIVAGAASQPHYAYGSPYYAPPPAPTYSGQYGYQNPGYAQTDYGYASDNQDYAPAYAPAYRQRCRVVQAPVQDDWGRVVGYVPDRRCR